MGDATFEPLQVQECRELLQTTTVGRVAFLSPDGVQLLPVNFVVWDGAICFRTDPESLLGVAAEVAEQMVFEVDYHAEMYQNGWSVVARGRAHLVDDPQLIEQVRASGRPSPWAAGDRSLLVAIDIESLTGRRVGRR